MTPYGWVILAFVMALQSVSLSGTLKAFQLAPQKEGILFFILHSPMFWFYFLFIFPLLTMRSLAEEEKTGTLESRGVGGIPRSGDFPLHVLLGTSGPLFRRAG